jgi:hypothetical protein
MIPNIFISSTVDDLRYLRDAIREIIQEIGYIPRMSEYGDLGYSPSSSAENSCYKALKECHIALLIIGKRYGEPKSNELSVTHNEFRAARESQVPIINLVDKEVLTSKKIFDANKIEQSLTFPGMDYPAKTFALIDEIMDSPVNNAYLDFSDVTSARNHIKNQLAHMFGEYLSKNIDPLKSDVKDILSEIKTLRHEIKPDPTKDVLKFMKAVRLLLDDNYKQYRVVLEHLYDTIESSIADLIESNSFAELIQRATKNKIEIVDINTFDGVRDYLKSRTGLRFASYGGQKNTTLPTATLFGICHDRSKVIMNDNNLRQFEALHKSLQSAIEKTNIEKA